MLFLYSAVDLLNLQPVIEKNSQLIIAGGNSIGDRELDGTFIGISFEDCYAILGVEQGPGITGLSAG